MVSLVIVKARILSLKAISGSIKAEGLCTNFLDDVASDMGLPIIGIRVLPCGKEPRHDEFFNRWFLHGDVCLWGVRDRGGWVRGEQWSVR